MKNSPKLVLLSLGITLLAVAFRSPLRELVRNHATLANEAPALEVVEEMILQSGNPSTALSEAWNSGKIVQREVAIQCLSKILPAEKPLPPQMESILLAAALDPDMNVRESAFGVLQQRKHPALTALAAAQLGDVDQQVRLLGLRNFKDADPSEGVPFVAGLLEDPDIAVLGMSLKLLENWSGESFGAKVADTVPLESKTTGLLEFQPEGMAKTAAAAAKARTWWAAHKGEYPLVKRTLPEIATTSLHRFQAADFALSTLDGKKVSLSDFRGKVVVLNFWTTWCSACVGEMPALVALQKEHGENLAILGVSLDFVPDEHGDLGGHPAVEEQNHPESDHEAKVTTAEAFKKIHEKIERTAKARKINYPILLDEQNEAGGRYNGGELPTTVIVDAQGMIRRRFIGARNLAVFEAMIAEARLNRDANLTNSL